MSDVLVIGSGVAGMWFALRAARYSDVTVLTKATGHESNSRHAQGGIAAVWDEDDAFQSHIDDTLVAGAGLCRRDAVEQTVRQGPDRVRELIEFGAVFTRQTDHPERYSLHREGGHSCRRILHAADLTGAEMVRALHDACQANPRITMLENHIAIDVITYNKVARKKGDMPIIKDRVLGAYVLNEATGQVRSFKSKVVVLATGGAGKVYNYTSNPMLATGDGMAMAYRVGARIANMEFVQFHPTCLFHPTENSFLISEALRGEGAKLVHADGSRFMPEYDERAELAPRDIVARAIDSELKRGGLSCVYLDIRHVKSEDLRRMFPNIHARLMGLGIDMSTDLIPVVPAAHYFCGGVQTDLMGESSIENLFAVGETACTGLHGANRLASNSLLEALVFSERAAEAVEQRLPEIYVRLELPAWELGSAVDSDELVLVKQTWEEIRRFMWNYVGIVRTHRRLKRARRRIQLLQDEIRSYYWDFKLTRDLIELRNLLTVSDLVVRSALSRRESRGLHFNADFPESNPRFVGDTVLERRL